MVHAVSNWSKRVIQDCKTTQYRIDDSMENVMVDGKSHFVHERRLSVIIDPRYGANTLWFVHFLCKHVHILKFKFFEVQVF